MLLFIIMQFILHLTIWNQNFYWLYIAQLKEKFQVLFGL